MFKVVNYGFDIDLPPRLLEPLNPPVKASVLVYGLKVPPISFYSIVLN